MFPTGPESVRIVYDWLFEPRHLPLSEADLQHYVALWEITNAQDARNCEWQQQGMHVLRLPARPLRAAGIRLPTASRSGCAGDSASTSPRRARSAGAR